MMLPRQLYIPALVVTSLLVVGCGPMQSSSSALVNLDGNVYLNGIQEIKFALQEEPNPSDPDAFRLMAASAKRLESGSVRFCFGTLLDCRAGTGTSVQGTEDTSTGKTIFVSEQYVKIAAELQIHILARSDLGLDMVESYQIKSKGLSSNTLADAGQGLNNGNINDGKINNISQNVDTGDCFGAPNDMVCQIEKAVWRLTNEKRESHGKPPFAFAKHIGCAARLWSVEMGNRGNISHDWFSNGTLEQKYRSECQGRGSLMSENVAMSGGAGNDPEAIARQFINMWWNSPGHKSNMLSNMKSMGVGFAQSGHAWYGTQNMGSE